MGSRVPSTAQVRLGAAVSIVLKQDQATGRQVQGRVQDVLTRGEHPRGIKVRLADGRIGRVQRMLDDSREEATIRIPTAAELRQDMAEQERARGGAARAPYRSERLGVRYTDYRNDEASGEPEAEMDLMAFVKQTKPKKKGKGEGKKDAAAAAAATEDDDRGAALAEGAGNARDQGTSAVVKCPVCNAFEGDEVAVSYHVENGCASK